MTSTVRFFHAILNCVKAHDRIWRHWQQVSQPIQKLFCQLNQSGFELTEYDSAIGISNEDCRFQPETRQQSGRYRRTTTCEGDRTLKGLGFLWWIWWANWTFCQTAKEELQWFSPEKANPETANPETDVPEPNTETTQANSPNSERQRTRKQIKWFFEEVSTHELFCACARISRKLLQVHANFEKICMYTHMHPVVRPPSLLRRTPPYPTSNWLSNLSNYLGIGVRASTNPSTRAARLPSTPHEFIARLTSMSAIQVSLDRFLVSYCDTISTVPQLCNFMCAKLSANSIKRSSIRFKVIQPVHYCVILGFALSCYQCSDFF